MTGQNYPPEFLKRLKSVTAKRPRVVIDHILTHGSITTEELQRLGYNHPPRAARDVRELGIPLVTTRVRGDDGRLIGAYTFGEPDQLVAGLTGRTAISKKFKKELLALTGPVCSVCGHTYTERYIQVDHRIPVSIGGDELDENRLLESYMPLCGSCNTAKAWSCTHCPNLQKRNLDTCQSCYWADPTGDYDHVATVPERRITLVWQGDETYDYVSLVRSAKRANLALADYIKSRLS